MLPILEDLDIWVANIVDPDWTTSVGALQTANGQMVELAQKKGVKVSCTLVAVGAIMGGGAGGGKGV